MHNQPRHFGEGAAGTSSGNGGVAETDVLPPLPVYNPTEPTRVRIDRATMQNPCFWILIGVVGTVAVGALIVYASNNRD